MWLTFLPLQSIVTSYAGYVIDLAIEILSTESRVDRITNQARQAVIDALKTSFENDQDGKLQLSSPQFLYLQKYQTSGNHLHTLARSSRLSFPTSIIPAVSPQTTL
jgi:hypothetical protein